MNAVREGMAGEDVTEQDAEDRNKLEMEHSQRASRTG